jgi:hypothetical protein
LTRCATVWGDGNDICSYLIFERRNTNLIELVKIAAENCGELAALK